MLKKEIFVQINGIAKKHRIYYTDMVLYLKPSVNPELRKKVPYLYSNCL